MIVWSTANRTDALCLVRVEGIERGTTEREVRTFAQGAAAAHNKGHRITGSALEWADEHGRALPEGSDTTEATCARVLCRVVEP